jgi:dihydrofolate reductase
MNRKLKLQVQMSIDGFVAGPNGEMDWMTWNWDEELKDYGRKLTDSVDTILLGRKMTEGFVSHWTNVAANPKNPEFEFAKKMVDYHKVVFTKTLDKSAWANTDLAKGNLADEIKKLKNGTGKDIIVYGGATFVSNLISEKLIDEFHLFVNPAAIGSGMSIFSKLAEKQNLKLIKSKVFDCGITLLNYQI